MDKSQFLKLKKQIEKIIDKAENEALNEGVIISSTEFQNLLTELKRKILDEWGINLEDYELAEIEIENKEIEEDEVIKLGEKTKIFSEARKKEFKERMDEITDSFKQEIQNLSNLLRGELDNEKKQRITKEDIVKIAKPLIPKIPYHDDYDHINILRDLNNFENRITEINTKLREPTDHEMLIGVKPDQHHQEKHALENHFESELKDNLKTLTNGSNADKLHKHEVAKITRIYGGGGTGEDRVKELIFSYIGRVETPSGDMNDINKDFTVLHTPLWITFNGQSLYENSGYTLSGLTITLDIAPSTSDFLRSHYNY